MHFAYRYEDIRYAGPEDAPRGLLKVELREYKIKSRTAKGFWIQRGLEVWRFVLITPKKQFAHETKRAALISFLARKTRQRSIYHARLTDADLAIQIGQGLLAEETRKDRAGGTSIEHEVSMSMTLRKHVIVPSPTRNLKDGDNTKWMGLDDSHKATLHCMVKKAAAKAVSLPVIAHCTKPGCIRVARHYGPVGGYGKLCDKHANEKAAKQRAARKRRAGKLAFEQELT